MDLFAKENTQIRVHRGGEGVGLCDVLDVAGSGFYAWRARPASPKKIADAQLLIEIKAAMKRGRTTEVLAFIASSRPVESCS